MKEALILAAGKGMRLDASSNGDPKCLLKVGGRTLIQHQIDALRESGVERICIVVGYCADRVRAVAGDSCSYVLNARFADTNSLYSLWLARDRVTGPFLLLNSDVLAHPDVYRRVISCEGSALAFDSTSGCEGEHMKVSFRGGRLRAISKELSPQETDGENVGILRFDEQAAAALFDNAAALIDSAGTRCWAPAAVNELASQVAIHGIDVADLPWTEIDSPQDLNNARENVWPAISGNTAQAGGRGSAASAVDDQRRAYAG